MNKSNLNKNGKLIAVVAPSGAGKSTLLDCLRKDFPKLHDSVSYTTRAMRVGEKEGVSYYFISKEEFEKKIQANDFIEWAIVHNNYYGTSKHVIEENIHKGVNVLFEIDVQGADALKKFYKDDTYVIFIAPPSFDELKKRLKSRNTESDTVINIRLQTAENEMKKKNDYDYLIINDVFDRAYKKLKEIVESILEN